MSNQLPDSGSRRQFDSGAVRDMAEGKGRCDLLPLDVVIDLLRPDLTKPPGPELVILFWIDRFKQNGRSIELYSALTKFATHAFSSLPNMLLETAKHFEAGALKYDDNNWQKGIPVSVYIDSAIRHYLKLLRGDTDEPHDRAVCWNLMCAIWTCENKPELNSYKEGAE